MPWKCLLMMSCAVKERGEVWIRFTGSPRQSAESPKHPAAATKAKRLRAAKAAMAALAEKVRNEYGWP